LPSSQLAHAPPPLPQIDVAVPATHTPPLMQPVHVCVHAPAVHASVVSALPSLQLEQVPPALPQAVVAVPPTQLLPSRQPVQQLPATHVPAAGPVEQLRPLVSLAGRVHAWVCGSMVATQAAVVVSHA